MAPRRRKKAAVSAGLRAIL
jgi:hypothetical protein